MSGECRHQHAQGNAQKRLLLRLPELSGPGKPSLPPGLGSPPGSGGDVGEQVVDNEGWPQDGFDDSPPMAPESGGVLPAVGKSSDESPAVRLRLHLRPAQRSLGSSTFLARGPPFARRGESVTSLGRLRSIAGRPRLAPPCRTGSSQRVVSADNPGMTARCSTCGRFVGACRDCGARYCARCQPMQHDHSWEPRRKHQQAKRRSLRQLLAGRRLWPEP